MDVGSYYFFKGMMFVSPPVPVYEKAFSISLNLPVLQGCKYDVGSFYGVVIIKWFCYQNLRIISYRIKRYNRTHLAPQQDLQETDRVLFLRLRKPYVQEAAPHNPYDRSRMPHVGRSYLS